MIAIIFVAFYSFFVMARESLPPFVGKGSKAHLAAIPCVPPAIDDAKTHYKSLTAVAYSPQYNNVMELISHLNYTQTAIDDKFQDSPSDRSSPLPINWIAHNTVVKVQCQDGYYVSTSQNKSEFYARCYNGEVASCEYNSLEQSSSGVYSTYTGIDDIKSKTRGCLASSLVKMPECRQMCDVTKFAGSENYQVNTQVQTLQDFNGFVLSGAPSYVTYYLVRPQSNIPVSCINDTFLAHSTEASKHTEFTVSCNPDGYVEYPNNGTEDPSQGYSTICTSNYACIVPTNDAHLRGIYRYGNFVSVGIVPHGGNLYLYCNGNRKVADQNTVSCLNGMLFPDVKYLCPDAQQQ